MSGMRMELDGLDLEPDGYTIPADPTWTPPPAPRWRRALDLVRDKAGEALAWFGLRPEPGPKRVSATIEAPVATTPEAAAELGARWLEAYRQCCEEEAELEHVLVVFSLIDGQPCRVKVTGPGEWTAVPLGPVFATGGVWRVGEAANSGNGSAASGAGGDTPGSNPENRRTPMQDKDLPERLAEERVAPHGDDLGRAAHRIDTAEPIAPRRQAVRIIGDGDVRATRVLGESGEPLQRVTTVSFEHRVGEPPKARVETVLPSIDAVVLDAEVGPDPVTELRVVVDDDTPASLMHAGPKFVELEQQDGKSVGFFEWVRDPEHPGLRYLRIPVKPWQPDVAGSQEVMTLRGDLGHLRAAVEAAKPALELALEHLGGEYRPLIRRLLAEARLSEHGLVPKPETGLAADHVATALKLLQMAAPEINKQRSTALDGPLMTVLDALDELEKAGPGTVSSLQAALEEADATRPFIEEQCAKARTRAGWVERVLRAAAAAPTPGDRDRILMEGLKGTFKTATGTSTLPAIRTDPLADEKVVRAGALLVGTNEAVEHAAAEDSARIENVQLRADLERARAEAKASNDQAAQALSERDVADQRAQAAEQEVEKAHVHLAVLETQARILVGNLNGSDGMPQAWWLEAADAVRTIERLTTVSQAAATKGGAEAPRD